MNNALIIGFGGMGCRHAQSLLNGNNLIDLVYVIEPSDIIFSKNLNLIEASKKNVVRIKNIQQCKSKIDIVVIATLSDIRFKYFEEVIRINPRFILLEKVVFQSLEEFDNAILLSKDIKCFGNLVNRYFKNYEKVRKSVNTKINMFVTGPDFGLLCNSIHYIDLFSFIINDYDISFTSSIGFNEINNKRGSVFIEGEGEFNFVGNDGSTLKIVSDSSIYDETIVNITTEKYSFRFNENTLNGSKSDVNGFSSMPLELKYTSQLTSIIYEDMCNNQCLLPNLKQMKKTHSALFKAVESSVSLNSTKFNIT